MSGRSISRKNADILKGCRDRLEDVRRGVDDLLSQAVIVEDDPATDPEVVEDGASPSGVETKQAPSRAVAMGVLLREMPEGFTRILDDSLVFVASEPVSDRVREVLLPFWKLDNYLANPIFLWGHDWSLLPIGRAVQVAVVGGKLMAEIEFDPNDPQALAVRQKFETGYLNAVSVGYRPGVKVWRARLSKDDTYYADDGYIVGSEEQPNELLEISAVTVPALPSALAQRGVDSIVSEVKALVARDPGFLSVLRASVPGLQETDPPAAGSDVPPTPEHGDSAGSWFDNFCKEYNNA
jgi:phage head maturation protease